MNILEKTLAQQANRGIVTPGDRVQLEPSMVYIGENNAMRVINEFYRAGYETIHTQNTVFNVLDDPSVRGIGLTDQLKPKNRKSLDELIREEQEKELVVAGVDASIFTVGAYGAVPFILSPSSMANCLGTGKIDFIIPETIYIELSGVDGIDSGVLHAFLLDYFNDSLVGNGVIVGGNAVERFECDMRKTIMEFLFESGATLGLISPLGPFGQVESVVKINMSQMVDFIRK
ncbi:hypothetical protein GN156_14020 [bacterium LRH843]|nr:hypothetical protein [bacterium LRH843]